MRGVGFVAFFAGIFLPALTICAQAQEAALTFPEAQLSFPSADLTYPVQLEVHETPTELRIELASDVLFDFDKSDIRPDAATTLADAASLIREKSHGPVRVEGHTDSKGGDSYNQKLSERRAASVIDWLKKNGGLGGTIFQARGFGATMPVAPNQHQDGSDDPEGRQKNRRVTLIITK